MDAKPKSSVMTFEGVVDQGQIRLKDNICLPDKTKVYVVVPEMMVEQVGRMSTPRLARRSQAADFKLEVVETRPDAGV